MFYKLPFLKKSAKGFWIKAKSVEKKEDPGVAEENPVEAKENHAKEKAADLADESLVRAAEEGAIKENHAKNQSAKKVVGLVAANHAKEKTAELANASHGKRKNEVGKRQSLGKNVAGKIKTKEKNPCAATNQTRAVIEGKKKYYAIKKVA